MNISNIAKHLLHLAQTDLESENSETTNDEIFASEQLFEVLKSFRVSYFSELHSYDTLEFADEYDELTDDEDSDDEHEEITEKGEDNDEIDDYDGNEHSYMINHFTLEKMEKIIE